MEQLNNLDVMFLVIAGISALVGIARGMTKELLSIVGWVLAAAALFYLVPVLDPITSKYIASKVLASIVSGMLILLTFSIVWVLTVDKLASMIRSSKLSALDRIFGFAFGLARGMLIIILIVLMIITLAPEGSKEGVFAESKLFKIASLYTEPLKEMVPESWVTAVKTKSESLGFVTSAEEKDADKVKKDDKDGADKAKTEKQTDKDKEDKAKDAETKENDTKEEGGKPLDIVDSNLQALKKSGEELFNQLAQPKVQSDEEANDNDMSSDLDRLLDVLEDSIVISDEKDSALPKEGAIKTNDKKLKIHETVAD